MNFFCIGWFFYTNKRNQADKHCIQYPLPIVRSSMPHLIPYLHHVHTHINEKNLPITINIYLHLWLPTCIVIVMSLNCARQSKHILNLWCLKKYIVSLSHISWWSPTWRLAPPFASWPPHWTTRDPPSHICSFNQCMCA